MSQTLATEPRPRGYGANPPDPKWPNGARLAVNFVMNYEEGSEPSMQDGEGYTETGLTEAPSLGRSASTAATSPAKACSNTAAASASGA